MSNITCVFKKFLKYFIQCPKTRMVVFWGLVTSMINIEGGMFGSSDIYIFRANGKMYFVEYNSQSENQLVKDTTRQIFEDLKFLN